MRQINLDVDDRAVLDMWNPLQRELVVANLVLQYAIMIVNFPLVLGANANVDQAVVAPGAAEQELDGDADADELHEE